jgi:hypothetical protein
VFRKLNALALFSVPFSLPACSATVRRPWDSRRSTPDLLTLSTYGIAALVAGGIAARLRFGSGG